MEVPSLGFKSELQLQACTTAPATPDPSHLCNWHYSLWQCGILNPLSEARDQTRIVTETMLGLLPTEPQRELLKDHEIVYFYKNIILDQETYFERRSYAQGVYWDMLMSSVPIKGGKKAKLGRRSGWAAPEARPLYSYICCFWGRGKPWMRCLSFAKGSS